MLVKTQNWFSHRHKEILPHSSVEKGRLVSESLHLAEGFRQKQKNREEKIIKTLIYGVKSNRNEPERELRESLKLAKNIHLSTT